MAHMCAPSFLQQAGKSEEEEAVANAEKAGTPPSRTARRIAAKRRIAIVSVQELLRAAFVRLLYRIDLLRTYVIDGCNQAGPTHLAYRGKRMPAQVSRHESANVTVAIIFVLALALASLIALL